MRNKSSMVDRMAMRLFRAFTRLPLADLEERDSADFNIDNPALRFRKLQAEAELEVQKLESITRFWSRITKVFTRLGRVALVISFLAFVLAGLDLRTTIQAWRAQKELASEMPSRLDSATVVIVPPVAPSANKPAKPQFKLPSWHITLPVSMGAGLVWYGANLVRRKVVRRYVAAARKRDDFSGFMLRRRHIVPLEEDCNILQLQLERQRRNKTGHAKASPVMADMGGPQIREEGGSFFRELREKIALW